MFPKTQRLPRWFVIPRFRRPLRRLLGVPFHLNGGQQLTALHGVGHGASHELQESLAIPRVGDPPFGEVLGCADGEEGGLELGVRADSITRICVLIAHLARETRTIGEELDLLYTPARPMCVVFRLGRDTSFGIAPAISDGHRLAPDSLRPDSVTDAGLRA